MDEAPCCASTRASCQFAHAAGWLMALLGYWYLGKGGAAARLGFGWMNDGMKFLMLLRTVPIAKRGYVRG